MISERLDSSAVNHEGLSAPGRVFGCARQSCAVSCHSEDPILPNCVHIQQHPIPDSRFADTIRYGKRIGNCDRSCGEHIVAIMRSSIVYWHGRIDVALFSASKLFDHVCWWVDSWDADTILFQSLPRQQYLIKPGGWSLRSVNFDIPRFTASGNGAAAR